PLTTFSASRRYLQTASICRGGCCAGFSRLALCPNQSSRRSSRSSTAWCRRIGDRSPSVTLTLHLTFDATLDAARESAHDRQRRRLGVGQAHHPADAFRAELVYGIGRHHARLAGLARGHVEAQRLAREVRRQEALEGLVLLVADPHPLPDGQGDF